MSSILKTIEVQDQVIVKVALVNTAWLGGQQEK